MSEQVLDYDKMVEAYSANLDVTLRLFKPAEEMMLDTWVPDEDPVLDLDAAADERHVRHHAHRRAEVAGRHADHRARGDLQRRQQRRHERAVDPRRSR